jgi:hypothetical protein
MMFSFGGGSEKNSFSSTDGFTDLIPTVSSPSTSISFGGSSTTNSPFSKIEKTPTLEFNFSFKEEKVEEAKKEVEEKKTTLKKTLFEQTDEKKETKETPKVIFQVKEEEKVEKTEIQKDVEISDGMGDFTAPLISQNHDLCGNFHILNV